MLVGKLYCWKWQMRSRLTRSGDKVSRGSNIKSSQPPNCILYLTISNHYKVPICIKHFKCMSIGRKELKPVVIRKGPPLSAVPRNACLNCTTPRTRFRILVHMKSPLRLRLGQGLSRTAWIKHSHLQVNSNHDKFFHNVNTLTFVMLLNL